MKLFMANTGHQSLDFHYRIPENNRTLKMTIPSGQNRMIGDDTMNQPQIARIMEQGALYGYLEFDKVDDAKRKRQIAAIFRVDAPIPAEMIRDVIAWNRKEMTDEGKDRRAELAVVASNLIGQQNEKAGQSMQMAIEEESPSTMSIESGSKLAEGYAGPESDVAKQLGGGDRPIGTGGRRRGR
jgi:hypothetical protein